MRGTSSLTRNCVNKVEVFHCDRVWEPWFAASGIAFYTRYVFVLPHTEASESKSDMHSCVDYFHVLQNLHVKGETDYIDSQGAFVKIQKW